MVVLKSFANFSYVGAMNTNRFVQLLASDMELFGPVMNIGGKLRIDLFRVVRTLLLGKFPAFRKGC